MTINLFGRKLWHALQTPPGPHWAHHQRPIKRRGALGLLVAFALLGISLASGIVLSMMVVYRGSDAIAQRHDRGIFDQLSVTPPGGLGVSWAIFTAGLHYDLTMQRLHRLRLVAIGAVTLMVLPTVITLLVPALQASNSAAQQETWSLFLFYSFVLPMMYFDHIYAVVSGGLISILLPTFRELDARPAAIAAAGALHLTAYLMAAITGGLVLPVFYRSLGITGWLSDLSLPVIALVVFVLMHEMMALLLFRAAQERLNSSTDDWAIMEQGGGSQS